MTDPNFRFDEDQRKRWPYRITAEYPYTWKEQPRAIYDTL